MTKTRTDHRALATTHDVLKALSSAEEEASFSQRMMLLGIPSEQMTESVTLAVSALLEKLDDTTRELGRARETLNELEQLVDVDCIAPVPNRRAFMRRLAWAISMYERYGHPCSIIYFDLNEFKRVNDTYGHAAGDMAIRHVSKIFIDSLRASDFTARLSGDEFAILMYYATIEAARERGKELAARIAQTPFLWHKQSVSITVAYGAYEVQKNDDPESALAGADSAMYADKKRAKESLTNITA